MTALLVGYARVSTEQQDLTAQRDALSAMGITPDRIYVDHGLTGTDRNRPGLREAMAACRDGTRLWSQSWTAWPGPFGMPTKSSTSSPSVL
jgi:DNA invertase Pin-like site-specific DNA recombinase